MFGLLDGPDSHDFGYLLGPARRFEFSLRSCEFRKVELVERALLLGTGVEGGSEGGALALGAHTWGQLAGTGVQEVQVEAQFACALDAQD